MVRESLAKGWRSAKNNLRAKINKLWIPEGVNMAETKKKKQSNDQLLLDTLLKQQKSERDSESSDSDYFEYFCADQILKELDLSDEELQSGIVGNDNDGGIDAIYILVNGKLVQDPENHPYPKQNLIIRLVIIQAKTETGFGEEAINKFVASADDLFNSENDLDELHSTYNSNLLEVINVFRKVFESTAILFPEIQFDYYYITRATTKENVHDNVTRKVLQLEKTVKKLLPKSKFSFQFVGARELYETASKSSVPVVYLKLSEDPISAIGANYICLVNLADYYHFITSVDPMTKKRELLGGIFESNVRDYEGDVDVNKSIHSTLDKPNVGEDFWWLNNGVTALASDITPSYKVLTIKDLQIVNGLQTSMEIYNYFFSLEEQGKTIQDSRNILFRIIQSDDSSSRDRIIKATNYQTRVPPSSLRATDPFQEKIEDYLLARGYFYERRKNYYKNQGKPRKNIVSITYLAQAIVAIVLQQPNNAKGRPSTLLNDDEIYREKIFNPRYSWDVFLECIRFMKKVESFTRSHIPQKGIDATPNNFKYHLAMFATALKSGVPNPKVTIIPSIGLQDIEDDFFNTCMTHIWDIFKEFRERGLSESRIMKAPDFDDELKKRLKEILIEKN